MFYLYVIKSSVREWRYIGITEDPEKRLAQHNSGGVKSTQPYRPFTMIHREQFVDKVSARKRELFLKRNAAARKDLFARLHHAPIV